MHQRMCWPLQIEDLPYFFSYSASPHRHTLVWLLCSRPRPGQVLSLPRRLFDSSWYKSHRKPQSKKQVSTINISFCLKTVHSYFKSCQNVKITRPISD
jgi:hypothetical protein